MKDGMTQEFSLASTFNSEEQIKVKFFSSLPLESEEVESLIVNGQLINLD